MGEHEGLSAGAGLGGNRLGGRPARGAQPPTGALSRATRSGRATHSIPATHSDGPNPGSEREGGDVDFCGRNGQYIAERIDPAAGGSSYYCIPREEAPKVERPISQWTIKKGTWVVAPTREQYDKFTEILAQVMSQPRLSTWLHRRAWAF